MWSYLQTRWQSLVFRLLFYFLISMLALAIVLGISFAKRLKPQLHNEILPNVERYIEYLIDDIGLPPDLEVARRLADELPFELRIEGQDVNWSSSDGLRAIDYYEFERAPPPYDQVYLSHHRRSQYLLIRQQGYQYLFAVDDSFRRGSERRHGMLFLFLGLVLFLLYLAIRRLFKPVEAMSRQIHRIGEGELDQAVVVKGKSELALLASGINRMSARIKSMLENKSGLLLAISHELRSPITRMRVNLELLEESDTREKLIEDIREMESLVATILESEKLGSGHAPLKLRRYGLSELIDEILDSHSCRERIVTRIAPLEADIDRMRIGLLIRNLLDNACRYSKPADGPVELRLSADRNRVRIEVEDRGEGIDAADIPRLTEAFYRSDGARRRETGGYGLGLYLCRLIVDAHGGEMTIESEPGSGTRVIVRLPIDNS